MATDFPYKGPRELPNCRVVRVKHGAFVALRKTLLAEEKLAALRKADPVHYWESLDDRRSCILCEKTFSGRQVEVQVSSTGRVRVHGPTEGCSSKAREWVHPSNPLVSEKAWRDWSRVLDGGKRASPPAVRPQKKMTG